MLVQADEVAQPVVEGGAVAFGGDEVPGGFVQVAGVNEVKEIYEKSSGLIAMFPKDDNTKMLVRQAVDVLNSTSATVERLRREMDNLASTLPEYPVVLAMDGVGPTLGPQLIAEIGDVTRFTKRGALTAFAGVDPGGDQSGEVVLEAHGVTTDVLRDVTIRLHRGEILGIGGLSDCGIHDLGRVLCGLIPPYTGNVLKNEKENVKDAAWAVRNGIGYISKNRDRESLMTVCSIRDNICLPSLKEISRHGFISTGKQKALAEKWTTRMEVKAQSIATFVNTLSGGNKQKVVLAKWLAKDSQILILDCPTRGIDVGTKAAIYKLIMQLKDQGKSILLISEELQELIGMSDRIILLKDGRVSGEFFRKDGLTEAKLIQKMV